MSKFKLFTIGFVCGTLWPLSVFASMQQTRVSIKTTPVTAKIYFDHLSPTSNADILGWINDPNACNICGGFYKEPEIVAKYTHPGDYRKQATTITAKQTVFYSETGASTLQGDVTITQPGRQIIADKAILHRDKTSQRIASGDLLGHVYLREHGKLIVASHGRINLINKRITLNHLVYRLSTPSLTGPVNAWGVAKKVVRSPNGSLTLQHATYSTCPPDSNTWQVRTSSLYLNKKTGWGSAWNAALFVKNIPVFYFPYFRFPIDNKRKTGFLYPSFGYSAYDGFDISLPYYLNLAPNYDATITPRFITNRGVLFNGLYRYLTAKGNGKISISYINDDRLFSDFKDEAKRKYMHDAALSELERSKNSRSSISFENKLNFSQHWSSDLNLNYVSDDYFLRDFGSIPSVINDDQLLNQADLNYYSDNWHFLTRLQMYQTLHFVTEASNISKDQYQRLPQIDLTGDFPDQKYGFDYQWNSEFVHFDHTRDFYSKLYYPIGDRLNLQPNVSLPINWTGGYFIPKLQLQGTLYSLTDVSGNHPVIGTTYPHSMINALPTFDIDSGLFFERDVSLFGHKYQQTLEPRAFYLFVPYTKQKNIPIFDSDLPPFDFDEMFQANRFSGYDRIGDANQVALALTSRFLDAYTGAQMFRASIGQLFALKRHQVCIDGECRLDPLTENKMSPFVGELKYYFMDHWNVTGDLAWNTAQRQVNTSSLNFQYARDKKHMLSLGYNFIRDGDPWVGHSGDFNRIELTIAWPIHRQWSFVGDWNYNLSHHYSQTYFYGLQYDSCCWALRLVTSKTFTDIDEHAHKQYDHQFYLQFMLKGLGNVGTSNAGSLLTNHLPGYEDDFAKGAVQ